MNRLHLNRYALLLFIPFSLLISSPKEYKEIDFIKNSRQLIYEGLRSGEGYFSEDGTKLIFQSERLDDNPFYQIFILDFETGDVNQVSPGKGKTTCAYFKWGTNEDKVLFSSTHLDPDAESKQKEEFELRNSSTKRRYAWDYDKTMQIFESDYNGNNIKQLTNSIGYDAEASYSPDGKYIAFASNRAAYSGSLNEKEQKQLEFDASYFCDIYIMNSDGSNVKQLTTTPGYDGGPFFSPDGKKIIWRRFSPDGHQADIYTMDIDGSNEKRITSFTSMSWAPYFHPSGEYIIFASNKLGYSNFELYIVDSEGLKEPIRITYTDGFDGLPVFHPSGKKIAWTSSRTTDKKAQLFFGDWNHTFALKAIKEAPLRNSKNEIEFTHEISKEELKAKVHYISSDELEGRMTGSEGTRLTADYIINNFRKFNIKEFENSYRHSFEFISDIIINENNNTLSINEKELKIFDDFVPFASSKKGKAQGEIVFVDYGIKTPDGADFEYNSYRGLDLKDKFILVVDGMPENIPDEHIPDFNRYSSRMYKIMIARNYDVKGIIFISQGETLKKPNHRSLNIQSGIFLAAITNNKAKEIFSDFKLNETLEKIKKYNPHADNSLPLENSQVKINVDLEKDMGEDFNIVGIIEASEKSDDYIFLGAHYDHLGYGEVGSLATDSESTLIHNGADDNASGTALVLELAEYFAGLKEKKPEVFNTNIVFGFWSGEEIGLVGSANFASKLDTASINHIAYLNFDMVGRSKDNNLSIQGLGSANEWRKLFEKKNIMAGFNLAMSDDPYLPTDATSFYKMGIPVVAFFTGLHTDYHKPSDTYEKINYEDMQRIADLAKDVTQELLSRKTQLNYKKVEMNSQQGSVRGFTVYLGTIPDYVADVEGVKLSGVKAGGPADKAGLKEGDIIIQLAEKEIKNIYDYTNILAELKPDKEYTIKVNRDGEIIELNLIPGSK